jgi:hypothetical protein
MRETVTLTNKLLAAENAHKELEKKNNLLNQHVELLTKQVNQLKKQVKTLTKQIEKEPEITPAVLDRCREKAIPVAHAIIRHELTAERERNGLAAYTEDEMNAYIQTHQSIIDAGIEEMIDDLELNYDMIKLFEKNDIEFIGSCIRDCINLDEILLDEILPAW